MPAFLDSSFYISVQGDFSSGVSSHHNRIDSVQSGKIPFYFPRYRAVVTGAAFISSALFSNLLLQPGHLWTYH